MSVPTQSPSDHAVLIGLYSPHENPTLHLDELQSLVEAVGGDVVGRFVQRRSKGGSDDRPLDPATYIGRGKVEEVSEAIEAEGANLVVFDNELTPGQIRELEKRLETRVIDRSELILDIFAKRARTREAKIQVELAQLQYTAPRLRGMWSHLARQAGGGGIATRGPGEQQIEIDRRLVQKRIKLLRGRLEQIAARTERRVQARTAQAWSVGLVGYTNAGKSTLLNILTENEVFVANQLFATLDTVSRRWEIQPGVAIPLSDTVGFVRDLPHHLIDGFRSTLAEALHAALLLHVVDASASDAIAQAETVYAVLEELGVRRSRILGVLNKVDRDPDPETLAALREMMPDAVAVSALTGEGLSDLAQLVSERRITDWVEVRVNVPHDQGRLMSLVNDFGEVFESGWDDSGWHARARVPRAILPELRDVMPPALAATLLPS